MHDSPAIQPALTAREASRAADTEVAADRWDACSCWLSPHWPWGACSLPNHSELRARARAARSTLLDEAASLLLDLAGSLRDGEGARLLRLVDTSPASRAASLGSAHE